MNYPDTQAALNHLIRELATGQAIIRAIVNGERNPWKLVKFRDQRIRATEEEIARSLEGNWRDDMLFELKQAVSAYDFYQNQIAECDQRLQILLADLPQSQVKRAEAQTEVAAPVKQKRKRPRPDGNMPQFNLHAELERICGMDSLQDVHQRPKLGRSRSAGI